MNALFKIANAKGKFSPTIKLKLIVPKKRPVSPNAQKVEFSIPKNLTNKDLRGFVGEKENLLRDIFQITGVTQKEKFFIFYYRRVIPAQPRNHESKKKYKGAFTSRENLFKKGQLLVCTGNKDQAPSRINMEIPTPFEVLKARKVLGK